MRPAHGDAEPARRGSGSTDRAPDGFPSAAASAVHVRRGASLLRHLCCAALVTPLFLRRLPDRLRCAVGLRATPCATLFAARALRTSSLMRPCRRFRNCRMLPRRSCCSCPGRAPRRILLRRPKRSAKFPRMSARQQGRPACRRRSAPSPDLLRHRPCRYIIASPRKRASQRLARTRSRCTVRKPPSTRLSRSTTHHAANLPSRRQRTNSRPPGLSHQHRALAQGEKRGEIIPPSCHRFQRVEINDCPDRIIRLCRAAHAQNRADRTDAGPPFFRRGPQR